jgi:hypothetical protein
MAVPRFIRMWLLLCVHFSLRLFIIVNEMNNFRKLKENNKIICFVKHNNVLLFILTYW